MITTLLEKGKPIAVQFLKNTFWYFKNLHHKHDKVTQNRVIKTSHYYRIHFQRRAFLLFLEVEITFASERGLLLIKD